MECLLYLLLIVKVLIFNLSRGKIHFNIKIIAYRFSFFWGDHFYYYYYFFNKMGKGDWDKIDNDGDTLESGEWVFTTVKS